MNEVFHVKQWDKTEASEYILEHYYKKHYPQHTPTFTELLNAVEFMKDRMLVGIRDSKICGVAVYLALDDKTYEHLESFDINRPDVVARLMEQNGDNVHFILLCTDDRNVLMFGLRCARDLNPKSISWWTPDMKRLVKHSFNKEK